MTGAPFALFADNYFNSAVLPLASFFSLVEFNKLSVQYTPSMQFGGSTQNSYPPVSSVITCDQTSVTSIGNLAKYGATMNHVPGTSFVRSYSPKAYAKASGVPTRIDTTSFGVVGTSNY